MLNLNCKRISPKKFICHFPWLRKLSPTHTLPLISICKFSKHYKWVGVGHGGVVWDEVDYAGVGLCEVGWVMLEWGGSCRGGLGHTVNQLKNDSPQNQDLTP